MSRSGELKLPQEFYDANLITGVHRVVQSGKEATVYCCRAHPAMGVEYLAAKVYRPREVRHFKNDAIYQQGRVVQGIDGHGEVNIGAGRLNRRLSRAVRNKSRMGREVQFASWVCQEFGTLGRLYAAGADVPRPIDWSGNTILMEYIGDERAPAPQLVSISLEPGEVRPLLARILRNIEICLECDLVHGDLSPFNILYWNGALRVIDFPQSVDAHFNASAFDLLARDVENVCDYFTVYGIHPHPARLARQLWSRIVRNER